MRQPVLFCLNPTYGEAIHRSGNDFTNLGNNINTGLSTHYAVLYSKFLANYKQYDVFF
jgi:hypothetical protein